MNSQILSKAQFLQMANSETEYGEPQLWLYDLPNKRTAEITYQEYGLSLEDQFYLVRVHCSDEEFANAKYHSNDGVIASYVSKDLAYDAMLSWIDLIAKKAE